MNRADATRLTGLLRGLAGILKPFIDACEPGTLGWDGESYAPVTEAKPRDPYALAWWCTLTTMADLLDAQDQAPSAKQVAYVRHSLLGGMGSLQDFSIDPDVAGDGAESVNSKLDKKLTQVFGLFETLVENAPSS